MIRFQILAAFELVSDALRFEMVGERLHACRRSLLRLDEYSRKAPMRNKTCFAYQGYTQGQLLTTAKAN